MSASKTMLNIGRPVAYYPNLAKMLGGVNPCILFCQLMYWSGKESSDLGIYKSSEDLEEETGLSYKEQLTARKKLTEIGVLIETHKRLEHKIFFKLNFDKFDEIFKSNESNSWISPNSDREVRGDPVGKFDQYQENTTENTPIVPFGDSQSADAELPDAGDKKKSSTAKQPVINYQAFADSYNEILGDRLPTCAVMSDKRKRALKKLLPLLKAPTVECFSAYLNAFANTARPFYFGDNDRGWRASFDFVLRQETLTATKEGSISDSRFESEGDEE